MNKTFTIDNTTKHERLDKFLNNHLDISRNHIQSLIKTGAIVVNEQAVKSNYKLNVDDVITVALLEVVEPKVEAEKIALDVVYEDDDVLVINKPKGMVVHPALGNYQGTLVNGLLYLGTPLSDVNGQLRPGIVHRIDKDTSGLLLIAKNNAAHRSLSEQLQKKTISRKYYALVHGVIEHDFGVIDAPIGRDVKDRKRMTVCEHNSKAAVTKFKVLQRFDGYTLVECSLQTGRTHQIRVHMQYIKHPVVGDETYGYRKTMATQGQLLHAFELCFIQPTTKQEIVVQAPRPAIFEDVLTMLGKE